MRRRHQMRARTRQLAFLPVRKGIRQHHADHKRQHGIAQELHLLIVARPVGRLLRKRGVRESFQQELRVAKLVADRTLQIGRGSFPPCFSGADSSSMFIAGEHYYQSRSDPIERRGGSQAAPATRCPRYVQTRSENQTIAWREQRAEPSPASTTRFACRSRASTDSG